MPKHLQHLATGIPAPLADRVALIDGGTVVATGEHTDLMRTNDLYRALLSQEYEPEPRDGAQEVSA